MFEEEKELTPFELTPFEEEEALFDSLLKDAIEEHNKRQAHLPRNAQSPFFESSRERKAFTGE